MSPHIAIAGAGAAGCLCAIEIKRRRPEASVTVHEAGPKPLAKLALTGGGRCNLTNTFDGIRDLWEAYPRGYRLMKRALPHFGPRQTMQWFESAGIRLKEEDGGRIFPVSDDALQIVGVLRREMARLGIEIRCQSRISDIRTLLGSADAVVVATGGSPKAAGLSFLSPLGLRIEEPVPSLFTFRSDDAALKALTGTAAPSAILSIPGTSFRAEGPLLLTDWGFSGPATLRLFSYAARYLADQGYNSPLAVNWTGLSEQQLREELSGCASRNGQKLMKGSPAAGLPARLWEQLLLRSGLRPDIRWAELGSKGFNRLVSTLTNDACRISGRAAFKEEFVTCGGVSLEEVDPATLGARRQAGLYFAGEVLDIDAVTGGFNLQAAWTTGWICARSVSDYCK